MTTFQVGSATDTGRVRSGNEDALLVDDQLFAVADGMGGHQGGEVASALALETLGAEVTDRSLPALKEGVRLANRAVFEKAGSDTSLHGMGTTLCAIRLVDGPDGEGEEVAWVNVGDSRIYLYRGGELIQLSTDHSLVEDLVRDGQLTPEDAKVHPQRNILTRALGIDLDVEVDGGTVIPIEGDRFLLCSDGLFNEVEENRIAGALRRLDDPDEVAAELVRMANEHGGRDNITVVVAAVTDDDGRAESASAALAGIPSDATSRVELPTQPAEHEQVFAGSRSSLPDAPDDLGSGSDDLFGDLNRARTGHITWRVIAFLFALLLVAGAAVGALGYDARRTYYVGFADDTGQEVTIFKGRPNGFLWFKPTVDRRTGISKADVPAAEVPKIAAATSRSASSARTYVDNLRQMIDSATSTTTTTTPPSSSTTTTRRSTTTTRPTTTTRRTP
ncbi:MAG: serine/threonine protein phosphatase [Acidimicrobiales bacterium]|nr:serine/threonine protein phosphatase [Acidimicrobiales bacterium]